MATANNNFIFRSKFEKLLSDENRVAITDVFEKFCSFDSRSAIGLLWELTYKEEASEVLEKLGLTETISAANIPALRNELRYQYENLHGAFSDSIVFKNEIQGAYEALKMHADSIIAYIVYDHCAAALYMTNIERTLYLLGSEKETNFFGGIRSLRFTKEEAELLKIFHIHIHGLLKAMYENQQRDSKNLPLANLASFVEESGIELSEDEEEVSKEEFGETVKEAHCEEQEETQQMAEVPIETLAEEPAKTTSEYKLLTPEGILAHKDEFSAFVHSDGDLNLLVKIGQLGFDVNVVNTKTELIGDFLELAALFAI